MMNNIVQFLLLVTSAVAVFLTQQQNENLKKFAPIVGLISQPFWIYATYNANQWGMFILSIFYILIWCIGIKNYYLK